jgi:hypothetical protein
LKRKLFVESGKLLNNPNNKNLFAQRLRRGAANTYQRHKRQNSGVSFTGDERSVNVATSNDANNGAPLDNGGNNGASFSDVGSNGASLGNDGNNGAPFSDVGSNGAPSDNGGNNGVGGGQFQQAGY